MYRPKDTIGQLLNPCNSYREKLKRQGIQPKNYAKENRRKLRELQARNRNVAKLQQALKEDESKPYASPAKFQNVQPRAFVAAENEGKRWAKKHSFMTRKSPRVPAVEEQFTVWTPGRQQRPRSAGVKPPLPQEAVKPKMTPRPEPKNFIQRNIRAADSMTPPPKQAAERRHRDFGKVPEYLLKRNAELAMKKLETENEAKKLAQSRPGMRLLSEEERLHTLSLLEKTQADVLKALSALPLALTTYGQNQRMTAIQNKLVELEESIKLFSKPEVYVKMEDGTHE